MPVPFAPELIVHFKTAEEYEAQIQIRELNDFFVIYERFIGNYVDLEKNWYQFLDKHKEFTNEQTILLERFFNDPSITNPAQCICDKMCIRDSTCGGNLGNICPEYHQCKIKRINTYIQKCSSGKLRLSLIHI